MICIEQTSKDLLPMVKELELDASSYMFGVYVAMEICLLQRTTKKELTEEDHKKIIERVLANSGVL